MMKYDTIIQTGMETRRRVAEYWLHRECYSGKRILPFLSYEEDMKTRAGANIEIYPLTPLEMLLEGYFWMALSENSVASISEYLTALRSTAR